MRAQTRIFSVATTIACLAMASPAFAQSYGGGGGGSVQVDLGALDGLPGSAPTEGYFTPVTGTLRHYRSNRVASSDDLPTTIVGGGGDNVAPVTDVQTMRQVSYASVSPLPSLPEKKLAHAHHVTKAAITAPSYHTYSHVHHPAYNAVVQAAPTSTVTTDELNQMQLAAGKPSLPGSVHNVAMVSSPMPLVTNGDPMDNSPSQSPLDGQTAAPAILTGRASGSARPAPTLISAGDTPPYNPPTPPAPPIAALPPVREDYDEPHRQPAIPSEPPLPPAGPCPCGKL